MGQKDVSSTPVNLEALRLIREGFADSGMTQAQLSRACDIPRSTIANILSPTAAPRVVHVNQMVQMAVAMGADARAWIGELEAFERKRRGAAGDLGVRTRKRSAPPQVQKRAARSRSSRSTTAEE